MALGELHTHVTSHIDLRRPPVMDIQDILYQVARGDSS